jgi:hypothetical protein
VTPCLGDSIGVFVHGAPGGWCWRGSRCSLMGPLSVIYISKAGTECTGTVWMSRSTSDAAIGDIATIDEAPGWLRPRPMYGFWPFGDSEEKSVMQSF